MGVVVKICVKHARGGELERTPLAYYAHGSRTDSTVLILYCTHTQYGGTYQFNGNN